MEQEIYKKMHQLEQHHWWFVARRKIIKKVLNQFLAKKTSLKILEIGCCTGGNLNMLSKFGNVYATEIDPAAREYANKKNICEVKTGKLPDKLPFTEQFDLICLFDVLEHIEDDVAAIARLKSLLNPHGNLIITVPAYQFLWSQHDDEHHHKRRYTFNKLNKVLKKNGMKIKYFSYFNSLLFPAILVARKMFFPWLTTNKANVGIPNQLINKVLETTFALESKIIPTISFPFGVSLLVLTE
nr:class I SAM-dependent methyltransferase [Rhodospirillales bacterium]